MNARTAAPPALEADACPWQVSFKGALQTLNSFLPLLAGPSVDAWCAALTTAIATHRVANRPDRCEPRLVRQRLKEYKRLGEPGANYKRRAA